MGGAAVQTAGSWGAWSHLRPRPAARGSLSVIWVITLKGIKCVEVHDCVCLSLSKMPSGMEESRGLRTGGTSETSCQDLWGRLHNTDLDWGWRELSLEAPEASSLRSGTPTLSVVLLSPPPQGRGGCLISAC